MRKVNRNVRLRRDYAQLALILFLCAILVYAIIAICTFQNKHHEKTLLKQKHIVGMTYLHCKIIILCITMFNCPMFVYYCMAFFRFLYFMTSKEKCNLLVFCALETVHKLCKVFWVGVVCKLTILLCCLTKLPDFFTIFPWPIFHFPHN